MEAYYNRCYPHHLVHRLLSAIDPTKSSELVLRPTREATPIRHQDPANITSLVRAHAPQDGAHLALSSSCYTTLVLDVDMSAPRAMYCACTEGGKLICDNCWVAMAGTLAGYVYMLRSFFGCTQLLACFSGGRGWHLFVLDAHRIDRVQATHTLGDMVPHTAQQIAEWYLEMVAHKRSMYTLSIFDPAHRLSKATSDTGTRWAHTVTDGRVLALYTDVLLPFFCDQWRPRVLGCDVGPDEAVQVAGALLVAAHREHTDRRCWGCTVMRACNQASALNDVALTAHPGEPLPPLAKRLDAFFAIIALLWEKPDPNLTSAHHPIRLPWSPHERSGRFSLPLPLHRAHELRPSSQPTLWSDVGTANTTGDAWFRLSLDVVTDLLGDCERTPSAAVWPT